MLQSRWLTMDCSHCTLFTSVGNYEQQPACGGETPHEHFSCASQAYSSPHSVLNTGDQLWITQFSRSAVITTVGQQLALYLHTRGRQLGWKAQ